MDGVGVLVMGGFLDPMNKTRACVVALKGTLRGLKGRIRFFNVSDRSHRIKGGTRVCASGVSFERTSTLGGLRCSLGSVCSGRTEHGVNTILSSFGPSVIRLGGVGFRLAPTVVCRVGGHNVPAIRALRSIRLTYPYREFCVRRRGGVYVLYRDNGCLGYVGRGYIRGSFTGDVPTTVRSCCCRSENACSLVSGFVYPDHFVTGATRGTNVSRGGAVILRGFSSGGTSTSGQDDANRPCTLCFNELDTRGKVKALIRTTGRLPNVGFIFTNAKPLRSLYGGVPGVRCTNFGDNGRLSSLVRGTRFSVYPDRYRRGYPVAITRSISLNAPIVNSSLNKVPRLVGDNGANVIFRTKGGRTLGTTVRGLCSSGRLSSRVTRGYHDRDFGSVRGCARELSRVCSSLVSGGSWTYFFCGRRGRTPQVWNK